MDRFWEKVDKESPDGCWLWTGARTANGYGGLTLGGKDRGAHRVSLEYSLGRPLAKGMLACHSCRNRHCVNPAHLREGDNTDNQIDRFIDGTDSSGEKNGNGKLTEAEVLHIFQSDLSSPKMAEALNHKVSRATIKAIRSGRLWSWLTGMSHKK